MNLNTRKNLLIFSMAAEAFLASYGLVLGKQTTIVSILYVLACLIFIISILILPQARLPFVADLKKESILKLPLLVIMLLLAFITSGYWLDLIPMDPDYADMLPIIKVMNERFLHGDWKHVYDSIPEIWNGIRPIYLPAMWLPYAPAIALQVDIRWVTVVTVLLSFFIILFLIRIRKNGIFGWAQI